MAKYSKFNFVYLLQKWMDSVAGQTFMNYAYSWGASIVILGTLFKLTHLPGANIMLFIGMGTEVFVFFIAAFDRPFDKTAEGRDLATDSQLAAQLADEEEETEEDAEDTSASVGTVIFNGGVMETPVAEPQMSSDAPETAQPAGTVTVIGGITTGAPAPAVSQETAEAMEEATTTYVDRLNELNELLLKVGAQSERLTTDSEEMENLNRTLTGIARVYEMQLKSASQQITTQDEINDQTRKLAQQIADLNAIYARMIEAMSVNMNVQAK
ncbi:MAG: gliding motility protein GldL [Prevotella sp.]|nr:gliding motility protein GldL [Prevotella sp.]